MQELFLALDTDCGGTISLAEFLQLSSRLGLGLGSVEHTSVASLVARGAVFYLLTYWLGLGLLHCLLTCLHTYLLTNVLILTYLLGGSTGATPERLTELFVAKDVNGSRSLDMQAPNPSPNPNPNQ